MRKSLRILKVMLLLTITAVTISCRSSEPASSAAVESDKKASNPLEGVWRETEVVVTGRDASNNQKAQPSLYIFTPTHYAMLGTIGDHPRALLKSFNLTSEEKIAAFDSFFANAGTYEISGDTLTIRPVVARNPSFMAGGFDKYQFRLDGDSLLLTEKSPDLHIRIGEQVLGDPGALSETRTKLVRVR